MDFTLPCSWSIRACILSWFLRSSSPAKVSSLMDLSDLRRFLVTSPKRLVSASSSDSSSRMRVSILIMAFLPPFRALTSASSARVAASLHWASSSFLSFSKFMASSCSQRSSSVRRAASTIARAALSSDNLASLVISSRSPFSWPSSPSSFLLEAVMDWFTLVKSARVSLVSANSCSAARRWRSAVARNLGISSGGLGHGLIVDLSLGITHLEGVLLDGRLGLGVAGNGVLESQAKVSSVSLKLLLHPESLSLALGLSLKGNLHGVQGLGLG